MALNASSVASSDRLLDVLVGIKSSHLIRRLSAVEHTDDGLRKMS